jgi:nicotinamidase-related amidase
VPDPDDEGTQVNADLVRLLGDAGTVYVVGEAGSHCVRATTEHLADHLGKDKVGRLVLVTDCMSPVTGFEQQLRDFIDAMVARGAQTATASQVIAQLQKKSS